MQHDPKIVFGYVEERANLLAFQAVHLAHGENSADIFGQLARAIAKCLPEHLAIQTGAGAGPFLRRVFRFPGALGQAVRDKTVALLIGKKLQVR